MRHQTSCRWLLLLCLYLSGLQWCVGQTSKEFLEIKGGKLTVRQDLTRGGAIAYISRKGTDRNLVNISDEGRYIQQSYYAGRGVNRQAEGQSPTWSPWAWNPIQVGDYARNRAQILEAKMLDRTTTYVKCIPMQWDMAACPAEAEMEQWTQLKGNVLYVRNRLTCHRTDTLYGDEATNQQEIPAVYPISALNHLYLYQGKQPFTGEKADTVDVHQLIIGDPAHFWGSYSHVSEKWMAFVGNDGWGMGVYSPTATSFLAGRFGDRRAGEANDAETSYIAPIRTQKMRKNTIVEYDYWIILGTVEQIRKAVYKIHAQEQKKSKK